MLALPAYAPAAVEKKPLKIGLLLPYTGFDPRSGPQMEAAVRLKLDEIGWNVGGRKVELITEDDACDPNVGVQKAMKLIERDQVDVIFGSLFGNVVVAVAGYVKKAGKPYAPFVQQSMSAIRTAPDNVVLPTGTLKGSTYPSGLYAYDKLGYKTATILYSDYIAGQEFIGGFVEGFQKRGGTIVQKQAVPLGTLDFAPYLTNLKKADVLAFWFAGTMGPFLKQYYEFKLGFPVIAPTHWTIEMEIMRELGDKALGVIGSGHSAEDIPTPKNREFVDAMKKRLGEKSARYYMYHHVNSAYITTATYLEAAKNRVGDTSLEKIMKAWRAVKLETPMGVISFDKDGCGIGDIYVFKFAKEGGRYYWQIVQEYKQMPMRVPGE
jgi:branched-chain amino acid transport system substrate-binding protein